MPCLPSKLTGQITKTDMPDLKLLARGKVRDLYALPDEADADKLLFVATDRISAFDVIMENVRTSVRSHMCMRQRPYICCHILVRVGS